MASVVPQISPGPQGMTPRVLVIGNNPAGLTAAYRLAKNGIRVEVLDIAASSPKTPRLEPGPSTQAGPLLLHRFDHTVLTLLKDLGTIQSIKTFKRTSLAVSYTHLTLPTICSV